MITQESLSSAERLGLHIKVDKLLFHCIDGGRILSSLLQLRVYELVAIAIAENCSAIVELRRHPHEFTCVACHPKGTHQSDPAQRLQRS